MKLVFDDGTDVDITGFSTVGLREGDTIIITTRRSLTSDQRRRFREMWECQRRRLPVGLQLMIIESAERAIVEHGE